MKVLWHFSLEMRWRVGWGVLRKTHLLIGGVDVPLCCELPALCPPQLKTTMQCVAVGVVWNVKLAPDLHEKQPLFTMAVIDVF